MLITHHIKDLNAGNIHNIVNIKIRNNRYRIQLNLLRKVCFN